MINPIKLGRITKELSQTEFAKMVGVTPGAVSQWEQGRTFPNPCRLKKISEILEISLDDLLSMQKAG